MTAPPALARRLSLGVADQILSSGSNFLVMLIAARNLTAEGFGDFALAMLCFTFTLGILRALCSEALLVRPGDDPADRHRRARSAIGASFWLGILVGAFLSVVAVVSDGSSARSLAVLAVAIPGLLVQDTLRYAAFSRGEPKGALISDLIWTIGLAAGIAALHVTAEFTAPWLVGVFVVPGVVAGVVQAVRERCPPVLGDGVRWVVRNGDLSGRYAVDFLSGAGAAQLAAYVLVLVASVDALGALRGAQTLFGPVNILLTGAFTVLVPEGRHAIARSRGALTRLSVTASTVLSVAAALLLGGYLLLDDAQGELLLGSTWEGARAILVPVGLASIAGSALAGASAGLRSIEAASRVLRIRAIILPTTIALPTLGAILGGASGIAWGIAASVWWNVGWYWWGYLSEVRGYQPPITTGSVPTPSR